MKRHGDDALRQTYNCTDAIAPDMKANLISITHRDEGARRTPVSCTGATAPDAKVKLIISMILPRKRRMMAYVMLHQINNA